MRPLTALLFFLTFAAFVSTDDRSLSGAESPGLSDDWRTFRGDPEQRGFRQGRLRRLKLAWTFDAGIGSESTAAIVGRRVIVGTDGGLFALELDPRDDAGNPASAGKKLWALETEGAIRAGVAVREGKAYVGDDFGVFRAVDILRGEVAWTFDPDTASEILGAAAFHGPNVLYGSYDGFLYCLDAQKGELVWKLQTEGPVHATPAIADGHTFVAGCDEVLHVVDLRDGTEVASFPLGSNCASSPAVVGDDLYVGTFANQVLCLKWRHPRKGGSAGDEDRAEPATDRGARSEEGRERAADRRAEFDREDPGAADEYVVWRYEHPRRQFPFYASPAVAPRAAGADRPAATSPPPADAAPERIVVIGGRDKLVHGLDGATGKERWSVATKARIDSSAVIVGDSVLVAGMDGNLYLLDLATGKERWRYTAGSPFAASPAVGRGRVVITTQDGVVHCFTAQSDSP